ncbi:zeta toxin family protein [Candidatus Poriferisocius sp.]|uniref:zeta toxin family protein n=1 Tax=Candidatus Poriferisocius sp. TaxID=3101276 RepID=UPI003B017376
MAERQAGEPALVVVAGPNGAGKTTFAAALAARTGLEFVNADEIAAERWPGEEETRAYEAAEAAASRRTELINGRRSFIAETVFSHRSKVDLVRSAAEAGYAVGLHAVMVPEEFAVLRVTNRVEIGGHSVPEGKVRERYRRLWALVAEATEFCEEALFYDNTSPSEPFRLVAEFRFGAAVGPASWPSWAPAEIVALST